jgi:hypothetical protein
MRCEAASPGGTTGGDGPSAGHDPVYQEDAGGQPGASRSGQGGATSRTPGDNSQADNAGSIPVTRSATNVQVRRDSARSVERSRQEGQAPCGWRFDSELVPAPRLPVCPALTRAGGRGWRRVGRGHRRRCRVARRTGSGQGGRPRVGRAAPAHAARPARAPHGYVLAAVDSHAASSGCQYGSTRRSAKFSIATVKNPKPYWPSGLGSATSGPYFRRISREAEEKGVEAGLGLAQDPVLQRHHRHPGDRLYVQFPRRRLFRVRRQNLSGEVRTSNQPAVGPPLVLTS